MINLIGSESVKVHLALGSTDLRKSIDGLAAIVQGRFKLNPFSSDLYVFCNKSCNRIKILYWDGTGFWLLLKKLRKGTFKWPSEVTEIKTISMNNLMWLLDGLNFEQPKAFQKYFPKSAI